MVMFLLSMIGSLECGLNLPYPLFTKEGNSIERNFSLGVFHE